MTRVQVASVLPEPLNGLFGRHAPGAEIVQVAAGPGAIADICPGAQVLIHASIGAAQPGKPYPRPAGWPFDLRWVHLLSAGLDDYPDWTFDVPCVTSSPGPSAVPLAEFALAAIFAAAKGLPDLWIHDPQAWQRTTVRTVAGSTLGIVGFGTIGQALATRALALGMRVQALRRSDAPLLPGVTRAVDLADLFRTSDHVVLAAPANHDTDRMVDAKVLSGAKPGLHLVNVARGRLIDDAALLTALDSGRLSYATLDVTDPEPLPDGHPFYRHPGIRLSPHTAAMTPDMAEQLAALFAENFRRFVGGEPMLHRVGTAT